MTKKATIKDKVIAAKDELTAMKTHSELRTWAINNGMDNRSAFSKFKNALNEIGIDYDKIKTGIKKEKLDDIEKQIKYSLTLFVDAKASYGKFGICDKDGNVVWYGKFFDNDDAREQSRAELAAAKKAVWFASKVKQELGQQAIYLNLFVDAQWLTYQDHSRQKGYVLTVMAEKNNIKLDVKWIPGKDNPADKWTTESGFKKWQDNNFASLVENYTDEQKEEVIKTEQIKEQPKTDINQEIKTLKAKRPVKGKTEQPTEERTKEQIKADYDAQVAAIQEKYKNDFASLTEDEVILIGLKLNAQRSLYSQFVDNASDNKRRLSPTPENLLRWMQKPGYFDLIGVDTFERTDQTKDYKKIISKQKIFNLFGIKV